jgi:hypothetical protein
MHVTLATHHLEQWTPSPFFDCKWKLAIVLCVLERTEVLSLVSALAGRVWKPCRSHRTALILGLSAVVGLLKRANIAARRRSLSPCTLIYRVSSQYLAATNNKRPVVYPSHQAPFVGRCKWVGVCLTKSLSRCLGERGSAQNQINRNSAATADGMLRARIEFLNLLANEMKIPERSLARDAAYLSPRVN